MENLHNFIYKYDISGLVSTKFNVYKDEDSPVIYDIDEERALNETRKREQVTSQDKTYRYKGINLNRKFTILLAEPRFEVKAMFPDLL